VKIILTEARSALKKLQQRIADADGSLPASKLEIVADDIVGGVPADANGGTA
jgi:hypothetical protein